MEDIKSSIFNPNDKLNEQQRYYFEYIPQEKYYEIKRKYGYDRDVKKYYSNNLDDVINYQIKHIDLFHLAFELEMKYDKENKRWFTYNGNKKIEEKFHLKA